MTKNILLLTATVRPPEGAIGLVRIDPKARMDDYAGAMVFYLEALRSKIFDNIVFVDNSNSSLSFLKTCVYSSGLNARVELISYAGLDYRPEFGRTFGEFKLIDEAYVLSRTLKEADASAVVWKITGRYTVQNIASLIKSRPRGCDLYCNARRIPAKYLDLYCISWNEKGYIKFIKNIYKKLNVSNTLVPGENIFYEILFDGKSANQIAVKPRFKVTPYITGIRGFTNTGFNVGNDKVKYHLRVMLRLVAPWLWI